MTTAQTDGDRPVKVAKRMKNSPVEIVRLIGRYTLAHVTEDDAGHFFQQSRVAKMKKHAIPLVGVRSTVLQKKNAGAVNLRSIRRPKRLREDRDTASIQLASRTTRPENAEAVINTK